MNAAAERAVVGRTMRWGIRITRFVGWPLTPDPSSAREEGRREKGGRPGIPGLRCAPTWAIGSQPVGPQHDSGPFPRFRATLCGNLDGVPALALALHFAGIPSVAGQSAPNAAEVAGMLR